MGISVVVRCVHLLYHRSSDASYQLALTAQVLSQPFPCACAMVSSSQARTGKRTGKRTGSPRRGLVCICFSRASRRPDRGPCSWGDEYPDSKRRRGRRAPPEIDDFEDEEVESRSPSCSPEDNTPHGHLLLDASADTPCSRAPPP